MRVLAISGSLRAGSNNTALLRALADEAPEGVEVVHQVLLNGGQIVRLRGAGEGIGRDETGERTEQGRTAAHREFSREASGVSGGERTIGVV